MSRVREAQGRQAAADSNVSPSGRNHQVMRRSIVFTFVALMLVVPGFAQEEGGGGGDLGIQMVPVGPDNVKAIRDTLAKAKITLSRDQEAALKPIVEETVKAMEELNASMAARGGEAAAGQPRGEGRGGRGGEGRSGARGEGRGGRGGGRPMSPEHVAKLRELNAEFETKMKTVLKPDQVATWDAYRKEEIKRAGGLEALKVILADANAPLTPEQEQKLAPLYQELARSKAMLARQSQGQPDQAKLKQLDLANATQVLTFLNAAQRKALLDSMKPPAK
jgi:hypothetical protein